MIRKRDPLFIGLLFSFSLHSVLLLFSISHLLWHTPPEPPSLISVDIVTLGPQTQAPQLPKPTPLQKAPRTLESSPQKSEASPPDKRTLETEEVQKSSSPEQKAQENPEALPVPQKEKPKPKPQKKQEKKKASDSSQKVKREQKKAQKKKKDLGALLSEVEGEDHHNTLDTLLSDSESTSTQAASQIGTAAITEKSLIQQQLHKYWNKPKDIKGSTVQVVIEVMLTPDGKVSNFVIDTHHSTLGHPLYQVTLESAQRALNNPSFHIPLSRDRYDVWKELRLTFKDD